MPNGTRPVRARSIRSLANLVGRSASAVRKWIASSSWPFPRVGPWDVARVKAWMEIHLKPDPAAAYRKKVKAAEAGTGEFHAMSPLEKARIQATLERALYLRQRRLAEAGELHGTAECDRRRIRQIMEVRGRFAELPRSMAAGLAGKTPEQIEVDLDAAIVAILDEFAVGAGAGPVDRRGSAGGGEGDSDE